MQNQRNAPRLLLAAIAAATFHLHAAAIEVAPGLEVHGFGDAGYVRESVSPQSRTRAEHDLSLLGTFQVFQGGRVWTQLAHLSPNDHMRLDLLFFDGEIDAQTTVRIGQARLPIGVFNETRDVQSLRASASLPLLYAGDPVAIDNALRGVTLDRRYGSTALGSFQVEAFVAWGLVPGGEREENARLAGGRLTWVTPVNGLTLKLSGYTGHLRDVAGPNPKPLEQAFVGSARYEAGPWTLTAEAANSRAEDHAYGAGYIQLDRQLAPGWRAFLRAESVRDHALDGSDEAPRRHRRIAFGPAWDAQHWGLRLEAGRNSGRLAEVPADIAPQTLRSRWNDYRVSVNYIF